MSGTEKTSSPPKPLSDVDIQSESNVSSFTKEEDKIIEPRISKVSQIEIENLKKEVSELKKAVERFKIVEEENTKYRQDQTQRFEKLENRVALLHLITMKNSMTD